MNKHETLKQQTLEAGKEFHTTGKELQSLQQQTLEAGKEFHKAGEQVRLLKQLTLEAGQEFLQAGQELLEEARQQSESLRQQIHETHQQLQTVQQLFCEAGQNLIWCLASTPSKSSTMLWNRAGRCRPRATRRRRFTNNCSRPANRPPKHSGCMIHPSSRLGTPSKSWGDCGRKFRMPAVNCKTPQRNWSRPGPNCRQPALRPTCPPLTPVMPATALAEPTAIIATEQAVAEAKPRLGVVVDPVGVVEEVGSKSPAEQIGLQRGDVITRVNEQSIVNAEELREAINKVPAGEDVKIEVLAAPKPRKLPHIWMSQKSKVISH